MTGQDWKEFLAEWREDLPLILNPQPKEPKSEKDEM